MYDRRTRAINLSIFYKISIAVLWCFGLLLGSNAAYHFTADIISLMHRPIVEPLSIVGRYLLLFLPILLSALAIHFDLRFIILPIVFCKSFLFSYSGCCIVGMFGSAGWLLQLLLLFFDVTTLPFLLLFWFRNASDNASGIYNNVSLYAIFAFTVVFIDYFAILPFTTTLLYNL